jgi:hypothetical protein
VIVPELLSSVKLLSCCYSNTLCVIARPVSLSQMSYNVMRNRTDVKSNIPMTLVDRAFFPCCDAGHELISKSCYHKRVLRLYSSRF